MRLSISQQQLAVQLTQAPHLGLLSDETSKFGKEYEGFHVGDETEIICAWPQKHFIQIWPGCAV